MPDTTGNRRQAFRVLNPLIIDYEVLSEEEMHRRIHAAKHTGALGGVSSMLSQMDNRIREKLGRLRQRVPEAATVIEALNEKLNVLIHLLPMIQYPGARLDERSWRDGDLSALGVGFVNEEALAVGSVLYLRIMLAPSYYYVEAFARVARCDPHPDAHYPHRIGVYFEMISEEQRELLTRYTMNREAQLLRARRMGG
jgi:c-di-GMP-binding flagellar brake protein YcgR